MVYFFKKGDIIMSKTLATKLHDNLCPMCNGRCHCGSVCIFEHEPKDETVWDNNIANSYFLELAKKAVNIISETGITEEELIHYAKPYGKDNIPSNVSSSMEKHSFFN